MTIYEKALGHFGKDNQLIKAIEEMSELTKELSKVLQGKYTHVPGLSQIEENIAEEIADVQIMIEQLKLLYPRWEYYSDLKIKRLEELVEK